MNASNSGCCGGLSTRFNENIARAGNQRALLIKSYDFGKGPKRFGPFSFCDPVAIFRRRQQRTEYNESRPHLASEGSIGDIATSALFRLFP